MTINVTELGHVTGLSSLLNLALGAWVLSIGMGLGFPVSRRLAPAYGPGIQLSLGLLVGAALLSYGVTVMGLLGLLQASWIAGLLALLTLPFIVQARAIGARCHELVRMARTLYAAADRVGRGLMLMALGLTLFSLLNPLFPVTSGDALSYSTSVPARFVYEGRIHFLPDHFECAFVLVAETLHLIGYSFGLLPTGLWFEVAAQGLLFFASVECYQHLGEATETNHAALPGLAFLVTPLVQLMPYQVKAHLLELLAIVVALTLLLGAPRKGGWLGALACLSVAAATKYTAVLGAAPLLLPLACLALLETRRPRWTWGDAGGMVIIAVLATPFYLRNYAWTNNPFYPVQVFGFSSPFALPFHEFWSSLNVGNGDGWGHGIGDFFLWWPRMATLHVTSAQYVGVFPLCFAPVAVAVSFRSSRKLFALGLGVACSAVAVFGFAPHQERYNLAPFAGLVLLSAAGWVKVRERVSVIAHAGSLLLVVTGICLCLPAKLYGLYLHAPGLISANGADRVLARATPFYRDFQRIRQLVPAPTPILCLLRQCQYLGPSVRRNDLLLRIEHPLAGAHDSDDPRSLWTALQAHGVRHVLFYRTEDGDEDARERALNWIGRCAGREVYQNAEASFATRDPRAERHVSIALIELAESLTPEAQALQGRCTF